MVAVTDKMLSMSTMSVDDVAIKFTAIGDRWMAMFAGNDISPVVPIFKAVKAAVAQSACLETLEDIVGFFRSAIQKEMVTKAEATVLSRFGLDMVEFRQSGLAGLGSDLFTRLAYEIEQISLDLTFLVSGFEENREGHIFTVNGIGEVCYYDISGFWAIGIGQTSALGTLFGIRDGVIYKSLPHVLYLVSKAKFSAESAIGVGKETIAIVLQSDSERYIVHTSEMAELKKVWEATRGPDVPENAGAVASELLVKVKNRPVKVKTAG